MSIIHDSKRVGFFSLSKEQTPRVKMLEKLLNELCKELNLSHPIKNKEQEYLVQISNEIEITLKNLDPGVLFFGRLGILQKEKREDLFIYLMRANLIGQGTKGAAIGLDKEEKFLTLSYALTYEVNYPSFKQEVEDFVNYLVYWREEIAKKYEEAAQNLF